jgi:hypothetical protein
MWCRMPWPGGSLRLKYRGWDKDAVELDRQSLHRLCLVVIEAGTFDRINVPVRPVTNTSYGRAQLCRTRRARSFWFG